jgi:hypothetical protein
MYYPFVRGRQFELLALRNTVNVLAASSKIVPIVEPVLANVDGVARAATALTAAGVPIAIITNPVANTTVRVGDVLSKQTFGATLAANPLVIPTLLVLGTNTRSIQQFFSTYASRDICIVHYEMPNDPAAAAALKAGVAKQRGQVTHVFEGSGTSQSYQQSISGSRRIILRDGFPRQPNNASYQGTRLFSDAHLTYAGAGFNGIGDFVTVGDFFALGGGNPRAVVIHLTYQKPNGEVWIQHLLSNSNATTADPGGKFLEAVRKVRPFAARYPAVGATAACQELLSHLSPPHYPGLGKLKELSMRHHLELMASII